MLYVYDKLCCICLSSGRELFSDGYNRVDWDAGAAGVYFYDKAGSCRIDFKNERKLRKKKRKFQKTRKKMMRDLTKHNWRNHQKMQRKGMLTLILNTA